MSTFFIASPVFTPGIPYDVANIFNHWEQCKFCKKCLARQVKACNRKINRFYSSRKGCASIAKWKSKNLKYKDHRKMEMKWYMEIHSKYSKASIHSMALWCRKLCGSIKEIALLRN